MPGNAIDVAIRTMGERIAELDAAADRIASERQEIEAAMRSLSRTARNVDDASAQAAKRPKGENLARMVAHMEAHPDLDFTPKTIRVALGIASSSAQAVFRANGDIFESAGRGAYRLRPRDSLPMTKSRAV